MRHILFSDLQEVMPVALLVKASAFNKHALETNYIKSLYDEGISEDNVIAFDLPYDQHNKAPVKFIKEYLNLLLPELKDLKTEYLFVTDSAYFKVLTKKTSAEPHLGYVLPCAIAGYEHMKVVLSINYQQLVFNPVLQSKLDMSVFTLANHMKGLYKVLGNGIIHSEYYPDTLGSIHAALDSLHQYEAISCDIEAFSLRFNEAGVATVAFAWDQHNGFAFACDYSEVWTAGLFLNPEAKMSNIDIAAYHGFNKVNPAIRQLLRNFFESYKGRIRWHNAPYDVKVFIYSLWMKDALDTAGMLQGLKIMASKFDDTKIIAYLALNSTSGNTLGLKALAHEFAGNWAQDEIKDVRLIKLDKLLRYNLVDALSTNYVYDKYHPIMVSDNQEKIYHEMMLPSLVTIIQMELTGMPMCENTLATVKAELEKIGKDYLNTIQNLPLINTLNLLLRNDAMEAANAKLKIKQHPLSKFDELKFNPNSGKQLQTLLYKQMGLPVLDLTDTKQPATGADTLEKLINHTTFPMYKEFLSALIGYSKVMKILSTFIPAFEKGIKKGDKAIYLHGSFNLGGTVSGRLSSSDPNMQNLPAGSYYGKLIKQIFKAPEGWLFVGADFNSLEDYISALTTKDPNKLRVYTDKFDGHCLRAATYFPDQMPDITQQLDLKPGERVFRIKKDDGSLYYAKGSDIMPLSGKTVKQEYDTNSKI